MVAHPRYRRASRLDLPLGELDRRLGEMDHLVRADLLDRPDVGHVRWAEEAVGGTLPPAIEGELVVGHEFLAREHRVLLDPDERLAEVEP